MENIVQDLKESIEKHLPAQVGEVLQKRLAQATKDAAEVARLKDSLTEERLQNSDLRKKLTSQQELEDRERELQIKLADLETRERNLKLSLLETKLDEANKRADVVTDLARTVFKNPVLKTTENNYASKTTPGYTDVNGRWIQSITDSHNNSKTTTTELE